MAVFCSLKLITGKELTVEDKSSAHAGSDEKTNNILVALCRTVLIFTQNTYVNVVADVERAAEFLLNRLSDVVIPPGKIGREKNNACLLVDNARSACCNCMDIALLDT